MERHFLFGIQRTEGFSKAGLSSPLPHCSVHLLDHLLLLLPELPPRVLPLSRPGLVVHEVDLPLRRPRRLPAGRERAQLLRRAVHVDGVERGLPEVLQEAGLLLLLLLLL